MNSKYSDKVGNVYIVGIFKKLLGETVMHLPI